VEEQADPKVTSVNLLTIQEAAQLLKVKPRWLYKMAREGALPSVRLGRQVRIEEAALLRWIEERSEGGR
jgi:excisionase family DNA binding protein